MASANTSFPLAPLLSYAQRKAAPDGNAQPISDKEFARMVGVSSRTVARWRAEAQGEFEFLWDGTPALGYVPWPSCDEAATSLGTHPILIWGDLWLDLDRDVIEMSAKPENALTAAEKRVLRKIEQAMERIGLVLAEEAKRAVAA
jgi:hypothetical protein